MAGGESSAPDVTGVAATAGIACLTFITADISMVMFGAMSFVLGFGVGLVVQTIVIAVQKAVASDQVGTATSTNDFLRDRTLSTRAGLVESGQIGDLPPSPG